MARSADRTMTLGIRQARPEEAHMLTELTLRSKAYGGYDEAFMADARAELVFDPGKCLPDFHVYSLEDDGLALGFCGFARVDAKTMQLHDLWVDPAHIGKGHGKRLWDHAVNLAREIGFARIVLTSDPNAEKFYLRQGAVRIGEKTSQIRAGRTLPIMEYRLER
jgi:ribosomal protein S18 acetylase RimI-like enzyme